MKRALSLAFGAVILGFIVACAIVFAGCGAKHPSPEGTFVILINESGGILEYAFRYPNCPISGAEGTNHIWHELDEGNVNTISVPENTMEVFVRRSNNYAPPSKYFNASGTPHTWRVRPRDLSEDPSPSPR